MGLYRRLFKGASRDDVAPRSPEDARAAQELAEELRDLKDEIRKLREALQESPQTSRRGESRGRGGRGRSSGGSRSRGGSFSERGRKETPVKVPPDDAPTGPLVDYLKKHKVTVFEGQDDLARNEAFEHLARHLGQHFSLLANFYEKMKRAVATGRTTRVDIEGYSEAERSAAVQLGTLLYRHGMLKDFYYHRSPRKQLRVIPTKDGETQQFLTGGWLEIYVVWLLSKRLRGHLQPKQFQVLFNVKGTLPTGNEFEADLMASINGHLLWLECKTGQWQDYSARFRGLVKVFGTNRKGAGLVLIKTPDASTRGRATDMLDMTLLSLDDVENYVDEFLEVPEAERLPKQHKVPKATLSQQRNSSGRGSGAKPDADGEGSGSSRRRRRSAATKSKDSGRDSARDSAKADPELEVIPTSPEDATPLENPEPAKRLGKVDLEEGRAIPRRRRRRRSRARAAEAEEAAAPAKNEADDSDQGDGIRKELPIQPLEGKAAKADAASAEPEKPVIPAGMVAPKPNWPEVTEDREAKDVEVKADREAKEIDDDASVDEPKARRPRRRRRTKRVVGDGTEQASSDVAAKAKSEGESSDKPEKAAKEEKPKKVEKAAEADKPEEEKAKPRTKRKSTRSRRSSSKSDAKPAEDSDAKQSKAGDAAEKLEQTKLELDAPTEPQAGAQADSGDEAKPARKKRASKKKTSRKKPSSRAKNSADTSEKSSAKDEAKPKAEAPAKEDSKPKADAKVKEEPKPKAEAKAKAESKPKPEAKAKDEPKPKPEAKAKAESKPKPEAKDEPKPKAKGKSEPKADPKKSASGVTITPDLSAMMAASTKPKEEKSE